MEYVDISLPAGIVADLTPLAAEPAWTDGKNFRFINGMPQKIGGLQGEVLRNTRAGNPAAVPGVPRDMVAWQDFSANQYVAVGTSSSVYVIFDGLINNIIPSSYTSTFLGNADYAPARGYGSGRYGAGNYGEGDPNNMLVHEPTAWSLMPWGEDLLVLHRNGALFWWDSSAGVSAPAKLVSGEQGAMMVPARSKLGLVSSPERYVILFGTIPIGQSTVDDMFIRWSHLDDFLDFSPSATDLAGGVRLQNGTRITAAVQTRGEILVSTDTAVYSMRQTGDDDVFEFSERGSDCGALSKNAMVAVDGTAYWFGSNGFYRYNGQVEEVPCPVKHAVFDRLDGARADKFYAGHNSEYDEVVFAYCAEGETEPCRFAAYDYRQNVWSFHEFQMNTWSDANGVRRKPFGFDRTGNLFNMETGHQGIAAFLQSSPIALGEGDEFMLVQRVVPDQQTAGTSRISFTGMKYPEDAEAAVKGPYNMGPGTRKIDFRLRARLVSYRIDNTDAAAGARIGKLVAQVQPAGRR